MASVRYIAFEGVDGAGKSTVAARVAEALERDGHSVVFVREPGGTPVGEAVRSTLLDAGDTMSPRTEALLFAAARTQLAHEVIRPSLQSGSIVVSDRSVYSSLAYQGGGRQIGVEAVREPNAWGLEGVWPDMVVLLELDAGAGLSREDEADRISREGVELMERVAASYEGLADDEPGVFVRVDASRPVDDVVAACLDVIRGAL